MAATGHYLINEILVNAFQAVTIDKVLLKRSFLSKVKLFFWLNNSLALSDYHVYFKLNQLTLLTCYVSSFDLISCTYNLSTICSIWKIREKYRNNSENPCQHNSDLMQNSWPHFAPSPAATTTHRPPVRWNISNFSMSVDGFFAPVSVDPWPVSANILCNGRQQLLMHIDRGAAAAAATDISQTSWMPESRENYF